MIPASSHRWQPPLLVALVTVLSAALGWWLGGLQLMNILELKSYDLRFLLRTKVPAAVAAPLKPAPITLVMIDADTDNYLQKPKVKPRMFWAPEFGEAVRAVVAGGARVVGLDWYFSYTIADWIPDGDAKFFEAYMDSVQKNAPLVMAYERVEQRRDTEDFVPVYFQAVADGNVGHAHIRQDPDTFVRNLEVIDGKGNLSLTGRMAAVFTNTPLRRENGELRLGQRLIPEMPPDGPDDRPHMAIQFYGPRAQPFPKLHMSDVLMAARAGNTAQLKEWFNGRAVLIGPDDINDRHSTPFNLAQSDFGKLTEGTEIHANALSTMINGDFIRPAAGGESLLLVGLAALVAAVVGFLWRWPWGLLGAFGLMVIIFGVSLVALAHGLYLPVVRPELAVMLGSVGAYGARLLTQDRQRKLLENTFSSFVSRDVLGAILDAGDVPLGGTRQEVTVLFSDIRNFTTYCENRDPHQVVLELNEYFAAMAESIIKHGGMVNKYIGDGIMALFGAPVAHMDHARRAVLCARDMVARLAALNAQRAAKGLQELNIGVGIHTGDVVVGNIGARDRKMEYTAMGDTVNVASRIEGLNKDFGTHVLLSLSTRERMGTDILTHFKDYHTVKGRTEPLAIYTIEE